MFCVCVCVVYVCISLVVIFSPVRQFAFHNVRTSFLSAHQIEHAHYAPPPWCGIIVDRLIWKIGQTISFAFFLHSEIPVFMRCKNVIIHSLLKSVCTAISFILMDVRNGFTSFLFALCLFPNGIFISHAQLNWVI